LQRDALGKYKVLQKKSSYRLRRGLIRLLIRNFIPLFETENDVRVDISSPKNLVFPRNASYRNFEMVIC